MTTVILDHCAGTNGAALNGRTPDTTNTPGGTWADASSGWTIQSNKLKYGGSGICLGVIQSNSTAPTVTCVVNSSSGATTGLVVRYADDNNFILGYYIAGSGQTIGLFKRVGGSFTSLGSRTINTTLGTDHTLSLSVDAANLITVTIDGASVWAPVTATDGAGAGNTKVGIYGNGTTNDLWDDFQADTAGAAIIPQQYYPRLLGGIGGPF